jgi:hypothetical protein
VKDYDDPAIRTLVVRAMASVLISSQVDLSDEVACWRRLVRAGFSRESIGDVLPEIRSTWRRKGGRSR